ncbi:hypothetical protein LWI29_010064 [Acer saccharum]|uniref:Reverse transcriptase RNase H-like domain-containing protein n=1 Tax=Acer saccharum TaxID=4024 RepID=A0AA39VVN8_ACESA|nr:hypothetical protein LWI29_010064 [Acer saccharum]
MPTADSIAVDSIPSFKPEPERAYSRTVTRVINGGFALKSSFSSFKAKSSSASNQSPIVWYPFSLSARNRPHRIVRMRPQNSVFVVAEVSVDSSARCPSTLSALSVEIPSEESELPTAEGREVLNPVCERWPNQPKEEVEGEASNVDSSRQPLLFSEGSRGKQVMGWAAKARGEKSGQTSIGRKRYSSLEKACLSLVWATQRLRHYMLAYQVWLLSRMDPLKYLFEKPALSGRTARWQLLLSEFDITYVTQKSFKARAPPAY